MNFTDELYAIPPILYSLRYALPIFNSTTFQYRRFLTNFRISEWFLMNYKQKNKYFPMFLSLYTFLVLLPLPAAAPRSQLWRYSTAKARISNTCSKHRFGYPLHQMYSRLCSNAISLSGHSCIAVNTTIEHVYY